MTGKMLVDLHFGAEVTITKVSDARKNIESRTMTKT
jgi:hypothetical protein